MSRPGRPPGPEDLPAVRLAGPEDLPAVRLAGPEDLPAVRLAGPEDLPALFAVRHEVFVVGQGVPLELERDALDADATHAVAVSRGSVVGTGRLVTGRVDRAGERVKGTSRTIGTVGRMAVLPEARGRGVGRELLGLLVRRAHQRELRVVELHAQLHAKTFYEDAGFTACGEVYLEAGLEHIEMRREL